MRVVGTAGHVDHGKSTLIAALTGIHPDRLKEEREREMTIDLGFAWLTLPGGETAGIVDVPGHRDFIENMLAGVGGIDAALFVIAADEGVMPQTREHLAILDILQIGAGVIALTKTDLVDDPDWLALVEADVRETVAGTVLADAPLVAVSARSGAGLDELKTVLARVLADRPTRPDLARPRLPVDRVFTIAGFGTVVTGTLTDGQFHLGDEVVVLPNGQRGRIRGLQTHKQKEETAVPGSRTAVNISGVRVDEIRRGNVLAAPGAYTPTQRIDARFKLLADASAPLHHNSEVKLFVGAAEVVARVRLLGSELLEPGMEGWLQLELEQPVVAVRGDRYILRRPSPGETLGGGAVVDPQPKRRHRRFAPEVIEHLRALEQGAPEDVLLRAVMALGAAPLREAFARARLDASAAGAALDVLLSSSQIVQLEPGALTPQSDLLAMAYPAWSAEVGRALSEVQAYHKANPLKRGMPREQLRTRLKLAPRVFNALERRMVAEGKLEGSAALIWLPGFSVRFSPQQQAQVDALLARFAASPYTPPSVKECQAAVGDDLYAVLADGSVLAQVSPEVVFRKGDYDAMVAGVRAHLQQHGTITVAEFRDLFNTSRKYALGLLEHLDAIGVTAREGDNRRLAR